MVNFVIVTWSGKRVVSFYALQGTILALPQGFTPWLTAYSAAVLRITLGKNMMTRI